MAQNAPAQSHTRTLTVTINEENNDAGEGQAAESATIRLKKKKNKKVAWREDTVDNEGLGRKTSKCCCVYQKPHKYDESSSDSEDDDCDHCRGHVEKRTIVNPTR